MKSFLPFAIVFGFPLAALLAVGMVGHYFPNWRRSATCDCCGKRGAVSKTFAYGIETYACDDCRGMS